MNLAKYSELLTKNFKDKGIKEKVRSLIKKNSL